MRLTTNIIIFCFLVFAAGCKNSYTYYISSEQMEDILYDMHRTEGIIQVHGGLQNTTEGRAYFANTLAKHGLTPEQFDSAVTWYTAHPETFIRVYGHVLARAEKEKNRLQASAEKYPYVSMEWKNPLTRWGYKPYNIDHHVKGIPAPPTLPPLPGPVKQ